MAELTLFWQLRVNYMQKECPTPQPVTQEINVSRKSSKMSYQIEISTADKSVHNTVNFLGKPVMVQSTFTFNPAAKVTVVPNSTWTPHNTLMASAADRMTTFNSWPKQMVQKPEEMVSSGFYYTGRGDVVQCSIVVFV